MNSLRISSVVFTSTAVPLLITDWDTSAPFCEYFTFTPEAHAASPLSGVITPECVPLSLTVYNASTAITMDVYAHLLPGMGAEAARKFSKLLTESRKGK